MADQAEGSFLRPARMWFDVLIKKHLLDVSSVCGQLSSHLCVWFGAGVCTCSYFLSYRQGRFTSCLLL